MSNFSSGCIYCGSQNYGRGCIFGPQQVHVITNYPNKCIYCGSENLGNGCIFNPYGNVHVRAATFFTRPITEKLALLKYFLQNKNNTESNLDKFYKKLTEKINLFIDPLIHTFLIQEKISPKKELDKIKQEIEFQQDVSKLLEKFDFLIDKYHKEIGVEAVDKILLDSIMLYHDK